VSAWLTPLENTYEDSQPNGPAAAVLQYRPPAGIGIGIETLRDCFDGDFDTDPDFDAHNTSV